MYDLILLSNVPICLATVAFYDRTTMTIPNLISGVLVVAFCVLAWPLGVGPGEFGIHALVGAAALVLGFTLFAFGLFGGGDAKLLAAISLWIGPDFYLHFIFFTALAGGLLALAVMIARRFPLPVAWVSQDWVARLHTAGSGIPYGVALSAGGAYAFLQAYAT